MFEPLSVYSAEKEYIRTYTYQASEQDSKLTARNAAIGQVQHQLLGELGTYVRSEIESKADSTGKKFSKHEIDSLTAGIIRTEILEEKWDGRNYLIKAKLVIDPEDITRKIQAELNRQSRLGKINTEVNNNTSSRTDSIDRNHNVLSGQHKVQMETSVGNVIIELYPDKAPETVKNFLRYVAEGKYDGTIFHRIIPGFMNQGGGFRPDFSKVATYAPIKNEADNGLKNSRGSIAMARTGDPDSATNQFFINTVNNRSLDYRGKNFSDWGYCVFGEIKQGMDVMDKIAAMRTGSGGPFHADVPLTPAIINHLTLLEDKAEGANSKTVK
jgi:cyclophilin family peptidyl-prolyl cis-trans isomerase